MAVTETKNIASYRRCTRCSVVSLSVCMARARVRSYHDHDTSLSTYLIYMNIPNCRLPPLLPPRTLDPRVVDNDTLKMCF